MNQDLIFYPVLANGLLALTLYARLGIAKAKAVRSGFRGRQQAAVNADLWPENVQLINNNIRNQFESPTLFYALSLSIWMLQLVTPWVLVGSWAYVVSRYAHSWVHTTTNNLSLRLPLFSIGLIILLSQMIYLLLAIISK